MERESLDIGFLAVMDALSQARGVLRDVIIPTSRYLLDLPSCFLLSSCIFVIFVFLCWSSFQSLIARSQEKSWFLCEQKVEWDCLTKEARLRGDVSAQLAAAQQREAEAHRDTEEIPGMF